MPQRGEGPAGRRGCEASDGRSSSPPRLCAERRSPPTVGPQHNRPHKRVRRRKAVSGAVRRHHRSGRLGHQRRREFRDGAADISFTVVGVRRRIEVNFRGVAGAVAIHPEPAVQALVAGEIGLPAAARITEMADGLTFQIETFAGDRSQRHRSGCRDVERTEREGYVAFEFHAYGLSEGKCSKNSANPQFFVPLCL